MRKTRYFVLSQGANATYTSDMSDLKLNIKLSQRAYLNIICTDPKAQITLLNSHLQHGSHVNFFKASEVK